MYITLSVVRTTLSVVYITLSVVRTTLSVERTTLSVVYITLSVVRPSPLVMYITLSVVRTALSVAKIYSGISLVFWTTKLDTSLSSSIIMSTGLDLLIPSSRPLTFSGGQSKNDYRARWLIELDELSSLVTYRGRIELGFSREEKREKMEIKAIMTTSSTKSKRPSHSQFLTDKKHCVAGRLMLVWYLNKYSPKNILFYPFFFDIFDARLPSVNSVWIEQFSFKTQTSHQPCVPCKNRIHLKKF